MEEEKQSFQLKYLKQTSNISLSNILTNIVKYCKIAAVKNGQACRPHNTVTHKIIMQSNKNQPVLQ